MAKPIKYTVSDGELVLTLEVCEEGGYCVTSPFVPSLVTQAETLEEAFEMARDVISLFEEDMSEERKIKTVRRRKRQPTGV
jgi:antitoxin HicB